MEDNPGDRDALVAAPYLHSRRQTAVLPQLAIVEQQTLISGLNQASISPSPLAEPLYLQMAVRSGSRDSPFRHGCDLGDINPGGIVGKWGYYIMGSSTWNCWCRWQFSMYDHGSDEITQLRIAIT